MSFISGRMKCNPQFKTFQDIEYAEILLPLSWTDRELNDIELSLIA